MLHGKESRLKEIILSSLFSKVAGVELSPISGTDDKLLKE